MVKTAIQLYTLDGFAVSEATKLRIAAETDVDGVEMVHHGIPDTETIAALEDTGLNVVGLSVRAEDLDGSIETVVTACEQLDCQTVVLGYLEPEHYRSVQATRETAQTLSRYSETLAGHGLRFLYHTHRHEFDSTDEHDLFDLLVRETDPSVGIELDLGWAGVAGVDPYTLLTKYGERIVTVHLKDMDFGTETFVNLGDGDLDVERGAALATDANVEWLIYEHEDPSDPVESVVTGASKLRQFATAPPSS